MGKGSRYCQELGGILDDIHKGNFKKADEEMNKQKAIDYWFNVANYDLKTAGVMFNGGRYLYVGFMCHQVVEKALKGLFVKQHNKIPPYTHNLLTLCAELEIELTEEQKDFFTELNPFNIKARYPEMKEKMGKIINKKKADALLKKTKDVYKWLKLKKK
ncbi:MAG: HEPN domain-containing protein [Nitrospirae bacterium]|nr:HEPN domain-containing protein [Nitrospirota bacterium]